MADKGLPANKKRRLITLPRVILLILLVLIASMFQTRPLIPQSAPLSADEARQARLLVKSIMKKLAADQSLVEVSIRQQDLDAIAAVATHTLPDSTFDIRLSQFGLLSLASVRLGYLPFDPYVNVQCLAGPGFDHFEIEHCKVGHLPVPGGLVKWAGRNFANVMFGGEVEQTLVAFLEDARISDDEIRFTAVKSTNFKQDIKSSIGDLARLAGSFNSVELVEPERVTRYLAVLNGLPDESDSLAFYMGRLWQHVQSEDSDEPQEANAAALWALVIRYGNPVFARALGLEPEYGNNQQKLTLGGRKDLALHFLYSIALEQVSRSRIGLNVGEMKEILDSGRGGSGFSFVDLAADKAGLTLSEFALKDDETARIVLMMLAANEDESVFFPAITDLPEGLSEASFKQQFGAIGSPQYKQLETRIDERIKYLPLYRLVY